MNYALLFNYIYIFYHFNPLKPNSYCRGTIRFNIQQYYFLSAKCIYVFCTYLRKKTATFVIYNINRSLFVTGMEQHYCAVRTGFLDKTSCFVLQGLIYNWLIIMKQLCFKFYNNNLPTFNQPRCCVKRVVSRI